MGVNTAGLKSKFTSFKKVIQELKPSVFFAQETKFKEEGQIKLGDEYIVYEKVRKNDRGGGGLAIGCLKELSPCWVSEGTDNVEAISINIFLKNMKIRCCTAYGPQENDNVEKYQPSGAGGTRSPPATPHHLQHLTARLIQNGRRGLERG